MIQDLLGKLLLFLLIGGPIILAITFLVKNFICRKRCTLKIQGKVIDRYTEEQRFDYRRSTLATFIVIEFEYNQEKYNLIRRISVLNKVQVNDCIDLMINPDNPEEYVKVLFDKKVAKSRKTTGDIIIRCFEFLPLVIFIGVVIMSFIVTSGK